MDSETSRKTKTFPLEIEDDLHKRLKVKAIQENQTLHSLIIDTLSARVHEDPAHYNATNQGGKRK